MSSSATRSSRPFGYRVGSGDEVRVETGLEEPYEADRDLGVRPDDVGDVALPVGTADLALVAGQGTQQCRLPPGQARGQDQGVELVGPGPAPPHRGERVREPPREVVGPVRRPGLGVGQSQAQPEVVDPPDGAVAAPDLVGPLVDDLDPQRAQHRQDRRERDPPAHQEELQPAVARSVVERDVRGLVEPDGDVVGTGQPVEDQQVREALLGAEVLLVGLAERFGDRPHGGERGPLGGSGRAAQPVGPRARGLGQLGGQGGDVRAYRLALAGVDGDVQQRELVLGHPRRVLDVGALEAVEQQLLHPQSRRRRVAVAGQVDHRREVAAPPVATQEQPHPAALGESEDPGDGLEQRRPVGAEQLRPRVGLEHLQHPLPGPRFDGQLGLADHLTHPTGDDRDARDVGAARRDGEDPEEPVLAHDAAVGPELPHPDVERVDRLVDGRARTRPGQDQQRRVVGAGAIRSRGLGEGVRVERLALGEIRAGGEGAGGGAVATQDAEPRDVRVDLRAERAVPVPEERQVPVGEPSQQRHGVLRAVLGHWGPRRLQLLGHGTRAGLHRVGVVDDVTHVREDGGEPLVQVGGELAHRLRSAVGLELEVHPRLGDGARWRLRGIGVGEDLEQRATRVPADHDHRVHDAVDDRPGPRELRDHRVDQVGHVVGDHQDEHAVRIGRARPGCGLRAGAEHRRDRMPRHVETGEAAVGPHDRESLGRVVDAFLAWEPIEVVDGELGQLGIAGLLPRGPPQRLGSGLDRDVGARHRAVASAGRCRSGGVRSHSDGDTRPL